MAARIKSRGPAPERLSVSMGDFVSGLVAALLVTSLIIAAIIGGAYRFVKSTHENTVLNCEIVKLEKEIYELGKCLQYRQAELERQENSLDIITTARNLGMRPAYSSNICYVRTELKQPQGNQEQSLAQYNSPQP
ncbi:MAG: hypothetical protein GX902_00385 [Lentisphaerae bacterium]|nr:hypothetical protein [Lentisphaerota bacterium]